METTKQCNKCNLVKNTSDFYKKKGIVSNPCKPCVSKYKRDHYDVDKTKKKNATQHQKHKANILARKKQYYVENKQAIIEKVCKRYNENDQYRLMVCIRRRTREFLDHGRADIESMIGCDHATLMNWFEFNFELDKHWGLTWQNFGKLWQIDHAFPLSQRKLLLPHEIPYIYSWRNLRPIPRSKNAMKYNSLDWVALDEQTERVNTFCEKYGLEKTKEDVDNQQQVSNESNEILTLENLFKN